MGKPVTFEQLKVALHSRSVVQRYPFPGQPELEVGVKLLTEEEQDGIRLRAQRKVEQDKAKLILDPEYLDRLIRRETVFMAFRVAGSDDESLFEDAAQVATLDALTVTALYELYLFHANALDPYAFASAEEVKELVQQLGKSANAAALLSLYGSDTLRSLLLTLVAIQHAKSPEPSSSTG